MTQLRMGVIGVTGRGGIARHWHNPKGRSVVVVENLDDSSQVIVKLRNRSNRWMNLANHTVQVKPATGGHGGADPMIAQDFLDTVLDGKDPLATPMAGRMSVAVGCAGTHSIRNGSRVVEISPPAL